MTLAETLEALRALGIDPAPAADDHSGANDVPLDAEQHAYDCGCYDCQADRGFASYKERGER